MHRNIVCILRIVLDSFPDFIRNSKLLFIIIKTFLKLPSSLYNFRADYKKGKIKNLAYLYSSKSKESLKRVSPTTDINSFHLNLIDEYFKNYKPNNYADIGCGTGFLINHLISLNISKNIFGIDFEKPLLEENNKIKIIKGNIKENLLTLNEDLYDFVTCTHVIEHLQEPNIVIQNLRRITSKVLIIICPLEKPYKWGLNYHINFFFNKKTFLNFVQKEFYEKKIPIPYYDIHIRLGDIMYVEYIQ